MYEVKSEIFSETNFEPIPCNNGRILSKFKFTYPPEKISQTDSDGDLDVSRKRDGCIEIEHFGSTVLSLVGLQVWRGALLLADYLFHKREDIKSKQILELGAGCGLTSIAAGIYAKNVISTDVNIGEILKLIEDNCQRNQNLTRDKINVTEIDFKNPNFSPQLSKIIKNCDIILAADVIYDDDLTDCFIDVLDKILCEKLNENKSKTVYLALEKRYVFTITDLDIMPPCYDYFLQKTMNKPWKFENIPTDFPQYFQYERCKLLVLLKITCI